LEKESFTKKRSVQRLVSLFRGFQEKMNHVPWKVGDGEIVGIVLFYFTGFKPLHTPKEEIQKTN